MPRSLHPLIAIFLTVLLDLLTFGMFISDIQIRGRHLGASGLTMGLMIASFSACQLIFAPSIGRLSDRFGRRGVLIATLFLRVISFLCYAHAYSLFWMFIARGFAGIAAANISVAYAYVADVTSPKERARGLGLIGAAYAIGFIFGVPFGAWLIELGNHQPILLGYTAAFLAIINLLYVIFGLPESVTKKQIKLLRRTHTSQFRDIITALKTPHLGLLIILYFAANFSFSNLESTFMQLNYFQFGLTQYQAGLALAYIGIVSAIVQGGLLRKLVPLFGEVNLIRIGYLLQAPMLILIPFSSPWLSLLLVVTFLSVGRGFSDPCLNSVISRATPKDMQGQIFGINQSVAALARMLSPTIANALFVVADWIPYALAGAVMIIPLLGAMKIKIWEPEADLEYECEKSKKPSKNKSKKLP